ncbi:hypothetical protein ABZ738_22620 [Micromonospora sp. NPDC047793]|uniref:hypothetical protein n=1 Tax=Micromonospora sp. NPDC047793 TaxID=3154342 RepID=UPI0033C1FA56
MGAIGHVRRSRLWIGAFSGVVAVAALLTVLLLDNGNAAAQANAQAVYCLAPERRADFLQAVANLKLGEPVENAPDQVQIGTRTIPLREWRVDGATADDFRVACAAFSATASGAPTATAGGGSTVLTFVLALVTALVPVGLTSWLSYLTSVRRDAEALRRSRTDAVRAAATRFSQAAEAYLQLRANSSAPGDELLATMHERRLELAAALAPVTAAAGDRGRPQGLRTRLETELRGDVVGRAGKIDNSLAELILTRVGALVAEAEEVATEYESGTRTPHTAGSKHGMGS